MKKRFVSFLLAAVMLLGVAGPLQRNVALAAGMTAIPVSPSASPVTQIYALSYDYLWKNTINNDQFTDYQIQRNVPIYSIQQANGYYSNYMKLRDIAHYLDFDVVWDENEPNVMRLYTTRHYLDAWTKPGPATENKTATTSTMDIYVDDVKVTGVQPVMIEYNNYFKVRDIAKVMDFWCEFKTVSYDWGTVNQIWLDRGFRYADEAAIAGGAKREWASKDGEDADKRFPSGAYAKNAQYTTSAWYTGKIGQTESQPVTYSVRDAWGNYDYTKLYFGKTDPTMNAMAQLLLDRAVIDQNHEGVAQFNDGNTLNRYYRYPLVTCEENNSKLVPTGLKTTSSGLFGLGSSNFGTNLAIHPISGTSVGALSLQYDGTSEFAQAREATKKTAASILAKMETYSCDAEKIAFLASVVDQKMIYNTNGVSAVDKNRWGIPDSVELSTFSNHASPSEVAQIWADNKVYVGVCEHYTMAFETLCSAAGYYYVENMDHFEHIFDWVWAPDEGEWIAVDCTDPGGLGGSVGSTKKQPNGTWTEASDKISPPYPYHYDCTGNTYLLDFFWMMEQIKPGGWLSTDYRLNP